MPGVRSVLGLLLLLAVVRPVAGDDPKLTLEKGDHVVYLGNTLADRLQHFGWLETTIQARFPELGLRFRNLGFAADTIETRPRSKDFGAPDVHITHSKADVIFAFWGYNESFAGTEGLADFEQKLAAWIDHTLAQKYNGESAPKLVLFTPIGHENLKSPHLPSGVENNERLAVYAKAIQKVGRAKGVPVVDLFAPSMRLYGTFDEPLTLNGIHPTSEGYRLLSTHIATDLFGEGNLPVRSQLERLREAVLDKNLHWFNRYRVTDGYNVYGGRSGTGNYDGQTNKTIMDRELAILDVMTANRDERIWAIANGGDKQVDDSNTPPQITLETNRPGPNDDGSYDFLSGKDAIEKMTIHDGMTVNLFASEEQFPEIINPVQSSVDEDGRLWVACWPTYPHWNPKKPLNDKLVILPDHDGDGVADEAIVFADGLHNPTGFEFWNGGVVVAQAPDIIFLKDTDGDDKADLTVRLLHGIDSADTHHTANSFVIDPEGWVYFQRGVFHVTGVESPWGPPFRSGSGGTGVYRFHLKQHRTDFHFPIGPNPHGDVLDRWGNQFVSDGTTGTGWHVAIPKKKGPKQLYVKQYRPVPGTGLISGSHFPESLRGNFLITNAIGFQGVAQYTFKNQGAAFHVEPVQPILFSSDHNFRPTAVRIGGDGALYVTDWQNPLIGHLQHNLRDPNRDERHGRVYRVTVDGRPLRQNVTMSDKSVADVVALMKHTDHDVRYRARLELSGRDDAEVHAAALRLAASVEGDDEAAAQTLVEALWLTQQCGNVDGDILRRVLTSSTPGARGAGCRVIRQRHHQIEGVGELLLTAADDEDPHVRHEALVAAMYWNGPTAPEVVAVASQHPTDLQLTATLAEAGRALDVDGYLKATVAAGRELSKPAQLYMLRNASVADLVKLDSSEAVFLAILSRQGVAENNLKYAIGGLAKLKNTGELPLLLDLIRDRDAEEDESIVGGASNLLLAQPTPALKNVAGRLEALATKSKTEAARRTGYAAWMQATGTVDDAFAVAAKDKESLATWLSAVPLVPSNDVRDSAFARIRPLMFRMPDGLDPEPRTGSIGENGIVVDFFAPHGPDARIETLNAMVPKATGIVPEMKIDVPQLQRRDEFALRFTGNVTVPRGGKWTFFTRSDDGSRLYVDGTNVVDNDGRHGPVEKSGTIQLNAGTHAIVVTYFDSGGGDAFDVFWKGPGVKKQRIPAKALSVGSAETLHDVAIRTLKNVPGREAEKFAALARLLKAGRNRTSAIRAMQEVPNEHFDRAQARALTDNLVAYLSEIPADARTGDAANDAIALTKRLAEMLPADQEQAVNERLANLDVRVIALGTVPHRMIYDKETIFVQAGKPVEFRVSNTDAMPHNFLIVKPGSMARVGTLAEAMPRNPESVARFYVPDSDDILLAGRGLETGQSQALLFEAPTKPGVYPFICTYPGHWRRMYGALHVVENLDEYEADPAAYLASHPPKVEDELLELIGKAREWKYAEFANDVAAFEPGRSFAVGANAFKVASCIACHRMGNPTGPQIGPDLTKLKDDKRTADHVLRSLLEPSAKIEDKFRSYVFVTDAGKVVTGMVVAEDAETVTVSENPLAKAKPVVLRKDEIDQRVKSDKSLMPEGLASRLTREEILDLVAFVIASGKQDHPLFAKPDGE